MILLYFYLKCFQGLVLYSLFLRINGQITIRNDIIGKKVVSKDFLIRKKQNFQVYVLYNQKGQFYFHTLNCKIYTSLK